VIIIYKLGVVNRLVKFVIGVALFEMLHSLHLRSLAQRKEKCGGND